MCDREHQSRNRDSIPFSKRRKGAIAVLAALLMVFAVGILALAVDVGYLCMARSQAQHCADAAALAAALEMANNSNLQLDISARTQLATQKANECAALQDINRTIVGSGDNGPTSVIESVTFGRLENPDDPTQNIIYTDPNNPNIVQVQVSCNASRGTAIPLFFARIFGLNVAGTAANATATFSMDRTTGFTKKENIPCTLMPFVIKEQEWKDFLANGGTDDWSYDPDTKTVSPGSDGIPELKMYPDKDIGAPGNFGTVNVGVNNNNSADELKRQIREGPTAEDMQVYDGVMRRDRPSA